jgi:hypothetical protein
MGYRRQGPFGATGHGLCRIDFARAFETAVRPLRTAQDTPRREGGEGRLRPIAGTDGATAPTQQANTPAPPPGDGAGDGAPPGGWGAMALPRQAPGGRDTGSDGPAHQTATGNRPRL